MRSATLLVTLVLAGCATTPEPRVVTRTVEVPVAADCVPANLGSAPTYVDNDEALRSAAGADERYRLVIAGREQRNARLGEVEPVIDACRSAAP